MRSLLALLLLLPGLAQALEKCVKPDGSVSYVDVCPPGTTRAPSKTDPVLIPGPSGTLPRKAAPVPPPPVEPKSAARRPVVGKPVVAPPDVKLQFYDIDAASFSAARNASTSRDTGPVTASWKLGYEYKVKQAAGGRCALDSLATKLDLVLTLPRWNAPAGTADDEMELWNHYVQALTMGEEPRFEHVRALERALPAELLALPSAENCGALETGMRARYEALRAQAQARFADHR